MQIKVIVESNKQQFDIKLDIDYYKGTIGDVKTKIKDRMNDDTKKLLKEPVFVYKLVE